MEIVVEIDRYQSVKQAAAATYKKRREDAREGAIAALAKATGGMVGPWWNRRTDELSRDELEARLDKYATPGTGYVLLHVAEVFWTYVDNGRAEHRARSQAFKAETLREFTEVITLTGDDVTLFTSEARFKQS